MVFSGWHWWYFFCPEELKHLPGNFFKCFLSKLSLIVFKFSERDKLHNVWTHKFIELLTVKWLIIGIKNIHSLETIISNTDNNDWKRQWRTSHNLVNCLLQVIYNSICNDQQNVILLVSLSHIFSFSHVVYQLNDWREVSWSIKTYIVECVFVRLNYTFKTVNFRIENVSI